LKNTKKYLLCVAVVVFLFGIFFIFTNFFETQPPQIEISPKLTGYLPARKEFTVSFAEKGRGLKEIGAYIEQDNKKFTIFAKSFSHSLQQGTKKTKETVKIDVIPAKLGLHDGPAFLVIYARDNSLWHWGKGNYAEHKYSVLIDTTPPTVEVLTRSHNIAVGGSVLTIYRSPEPLVKHGVKANNFFFAGVQWKGLYLCLFAYPYNAPPEMLFRIVCQDKAGNRGEGGFYYHIIHPWFKRDTINITDSFLHAKMPEFWAIYPKLRGKFLETFLKVNTELRARTDAEIKKICQTFTPYPLFDGAFLRMKGATRATFGDKRSYYYKGKKIGTSVHMGVDIASIAHAPVPAANNGIVVYKGYLGVYGNAVIIDHGLGLFSLYGHLSSFLVNEGQQVKKGDIIGYTGATGLAGGDHLHFSMLVQGVYVNPIEWWDKHWVKNNILDKMKRAGLLQ